MGGVSAEWNPWGYEWVGVFHDEEARPYGNEDNRIIERSQTRLSDQYPIVSLPME
jgi:hypothetical protein